MTTRVVIAEDCNEFRLVRLAAGDATLEPWLEGYLAPEAVAPAEYRERLVALRGDEVFAAPSTRQELIKVAVHAEVLLTEREPVDAALIACAPALTRIVKFGSDLRNVDRKAAAAAGVEVVAVPRVTTSHVADHVLMLTLVLLRRLTQDARLRFGDPAPSAVTDGLAVAVEAGAHPPTVFNWAGTRGLRALRGERLAIVGAGETGRAVMRRAAAFGMELGYWSRQRDPGFEAATGARYLRRDAIADWATVVSLHVPYAPELRHFVDAGFLRRLGPRGILINCARGLLVDFDALLGALRSGGIAGAGIDVYPEEPFALAADASSLPNLVTTPHLAAADRRDAIFSDVELVFAALAQRTGRT